jgi:hypothetical protein
MRFRAALLAALTLCTACGGGKDAQTQSPPSPQPSARALLIDSRGVVMTLADAVKTVRFVPFIPSAQIIGVAVIPPLSDAADRNAQPGLAIEYESRGDALLLSQWPRTGFDIRIGATSASSRPCAPVAYKADGLLWTTRDGRVMTLQPDGTVLASRITREADRLLHAGACGRARIRTLSRPLPAPVVPSRVVSSPRRSAF